MKTMQDNVNRPIISIVLVKKIIQCLLSLIFTAILFIAAKHYIPTSYCHFDLFSPSLQSWDVYK